MRYLFSGQGLKELECFLSADTLLAFDFDGTLAPIVREPTKAALPAGTVRLLKALSRKAPVAFLSGRGLADLKKRTPFRALAWIGNHGIEGLPTHSRFAKSAERNAGRWKNQLLPMLPAGVLLENKNYSLSLHYRSSKRPGTTERQLLSLVDALHPTPRVLAGKKVLNLLTAGQPHKGHALQSLMKKKKFSQAIFVGDDETDEDVFRLGDPRVFSVRIGRRAGSAAQAYLKHQKETDALLRLLLSRP